jgi:hypothetical protein
MMRMNGTCAAMCVVATLFLACAQEYHDLDPGTVTGFSEVVKVDGIPGHTTYEVWLAFPPKEDPHVGRPFPTSVTAMFGGQARGLSDDMKAVPLVIPAAWRCVNNPTDLCAGLAKGSAIGGMDRQLWPYAPNLEYDSWVTIAQAEGVRLGPREIHSTLDFDGWNETSKVSSAGGYVSWKTQSNGPDVSKSHRALIARLTIPSDRYETMTLNAHGAALEVFPHQGQDGHFDPSYWVQYNIEIEIGHKPGCGINAILHSNRSTDNPCNVSAAAIEDPQPPCCACVRGVLTRVCCRAIMRAPYVRTNVTAATKTRIIRRWSTQSGK